MVATELEPDLKKAAAVYGVNMKFEVVVFSFQNTTMPVIRAVGALRENVSD